MPILMVVAPPSLSFSVLPGLFLVLLLLALCSLFLALPVLLLPSRQLVELTLRSNQIPPWVPDSNDKKGHHDRKTIEGIGICLVEGDWIAWRNAAGELGHPEDDSNLIRVSVNSEQRKKTPLTVMQTKTPYCEYRRGLQLLFPS